MQVCLNFQLYLEAFISVRCVSNNNNDSSFSNCGASYNSARGGNEPKVDGVCDVCGHTKFDTREDDKEEGRRKLSSLFAIVELNTFLGRLIYFLVSPLISGEETACKLPRKCCTSPQFLQAHSFCCGREGLFLQY
jgi:hypothetical protein